MNFKTTDSGNHPRLILIFAGWGMDEKPFKAVSREGYDIAVVWDYRDLSSPWADGLAVYDEIAVLAWSFGVPAAADFITRYPELPVTSRIAANGTMHPVDDCLGIPTVIFNGTLDTLDDRNLTKFYRRMCGGGAGFRQFSENIPERGIDELRDELRAIASRDIPVDFIWDKALISESDLIIPPKNQQRAWDSESFTTITLPGPHLPDFNSILAKYVTDKNLVERRFRGSADTYDTNATVQREITDRMLRRVRTGGRILEIGSGTGYATAMLADKGDLEAWDLTLCPKVAALAEAGHIKAKACDAETELHNVATGSIELLFSASTVQWFNSLPTFLSEVRRVLAPGGTALISTFGPRTMEEIHLSLDSTPGYPEAAEIKKMIPEAEIEEEIMTVEFPSPADALRHIRLTGVNSLGSHISPAMTRNLLRTYPLTPYGKAVLTYHPIFITIQKKA